MNSDRPNERDASQVSSYLLNVAHQESPSAAARQRALVAIGLAGAALTVTTTAGAGSAISAGASGKSAVALAILKWGGGGLLLGTVSMGIASSAGMIGERSVAPAAVASASPTPAVTEPPSEVGAAPSVERVPRATPRASALSPAARGMLPGPALGPEAELLRIEALLGRGDRAAAESLADHFLAANPHHPLSERVRTLTRRPPEQRR